MSSQRCQFETSSFEALLMGRLPVMEVLSFTVWKPSLAYQWACRSSGRLGFGTRPCCGGGPLSSDHFLLSELTGAHCYWRNLQWLMPSLIHTTASPPAGQVDRANLYDLMEGISHHFMRMAIRMVYSAFRTHRESLRMYGISPFTCK